MHRKAAQEIWNDFQKTNLCEFEKKIAANITFQLYKNAQTVLNNAACLFYDKKATNPKAHNYVNQEFPAFAQLDDTNINFADLAYIHQPRVFDCGDASVLMLICFHYFKTKNSKSTLELEELFNNFKDRKFHYFFGRLWNEIQALSKNFLFITANNAITLPEFTKCLYLFGPIIVSTNEIGGHLAVVKGVVNNSVIIHDPWSGPNLTYPFEEFKKMWDKTMIVYTEGYNKKEELARQPVMKP